MTYGHAQRPDFPLPFREYRMYHPICITPSRKLQFRREAHVHIVHIRIVLMKLEIWHIIANVRVVGVHQIWNVVVGIVVGVGEAVNVLVVTVNVRMGA